MTDLSLIPQNRVENLSTQLGATVNTSGNQTISGTKTFNSKIITTVQGESIDLIRKSTSDTSGTAFADLQFKDTQNNRKGGIRNIIENGNTTLMYVTNEAGNAIKGTIGIGYNESNNSVFTSAPTPVTSDNSTQIATTAYVRNCITDILGTLYPVGSTYITTASTCPLSTLISGSTWTKVSEGRVLQGSDSSHNAGTTIEAGLPNITGYSGWACNGYCDRGFSSQGSAYNNSSGALYATLDGGAYGMIGSSGSDLGSANTKINIDASRSSSIYGNSTTVQPPAYVVNIFKRTA